MSTPESTVTQHIYPQSGTLDLASGYTPPVLLHPSLFFLAIDFFVTGFWESSYPLKCVSIQCFVSGFIDSESSIKGWQSGSESGSNPDPGFDDKKFEKIYRWKKMIFFFISKIAMFLSLGLLKERSSYRKSIQPSKENIQHFKRWNLTFFYFCGAFLPSWIRIHWTDWIRIRNTAFNPNIAVQLDL